MAQNPYATDELGDPVGQRTSLMAIFALVLSLICCIPPLSTIGALLGVVSLVVIGNSMGRLSGRAPAIVAIMAGLIVTVVQGAIFAGLLQGYTFYQKQMVPEARSAVMAAAAGDHPLAMDSFTQSAAAEISPERMRFFIDTIEASEGRILGVDTTFDALIEAFGRVYSGARGSQKPGGGQTRDVAPIPIVIQCDSGPVIAFAMFDQDSLGQPPIKLVDILVQLPGVTAVALHPDGPGKRFSQESFGIPVLEPGQPPAPLPPTPQDPAPPGGGG